MKYRFSHGGNIKAFRQKTGCQIPIDLSSNINFLKPKVKIKNLDISSYPNYDKLYRVLSKKFKVKTSELEVFNGATSAISSLFRSLEFERVYIYSPAYLEYKKITLLNKKELVMIDRFEHLYKSIKPSSLVVFVNPSTPDGKFYNLEKLFEIWKNSDATVLLDESFLEFCKECKTAVNYLKSYKKLYILKSLTKFYSSAGARLGVVLSNKKNIKKLKRYEPLWKISEYDKTYYIKALEDKKFVKKTLKKTKKNRELLTKKLLSLDEVEQVFPSCANFVLVKLKTDAKSFVKKYEKRCIMIRECENFDFLDEKYVRIAVKSKKSIRML